VKRDLKDWCITKELALDRVEASNSCSKTLIFGSFFFIVFMLKKFPPPFAIFLFRVLLSFPPFLIYFFIVLHFPPFLSLFCPCFFGSCDFISSLPQLGWD
jgi:hypothetical protein